MKYVNLEQAIQLYRGVVDEAPVIRDVGLLVSALERPAVTVFGQDVYPDIHSKAAVVMQSVICNQSMVDGNKRMSWITMKATYLLNGYRLDGGSENDHFDLCVSAEQAGGMEWKKIASTLESWSSTL